MKSIPIGGSGSPLSSSRLAYGCWRIAERDAAPGSGRRAVLAAVDAGYTLFDHADIYCDGEAEKVFGQVLKEVRGLRDCVVLATKCGIRKRGDPNPDSPYRYDFSADYISRSCEGSLKRLGVDTIDLYQLHRPDYLMDPDEVCGAIVRLCEEGKVREFGVSNFNPTQVATLQRACGMLIRANQVEISLANLSCFEDGTLDQCLTEQITPMAWSPLAGGLLGDGPRRILASQETYKPAAVVAALDAMAKTRGTIRTVVALAWLLRHPGCIIPIVGSTDPQRIRQAAAADDFEMSHEEWYRLLDAAHGQKLP